MTNILALSAFTNKKIIQDLLSLGVKQVISKPDLSSSQRYYDEVLFL
jgi:hypothetical protein